MRTAVHTPLVVGRPEGLSGVALGLLPVVGLVGLPAAAETQPFRTPAGRSRATTRERPTCSQVSTTAVASL